MEDSADRAHASIDGRKAIMHHLRLLRLVSLVLIVAEMTAGGYCCCHSCDRSLSR